MSLTLSADEVVTRLTRAGTYTVRRADGSVVAAESGLPEGYWVGDYFAQLGGDAERYRGPDIDGVEPTWAPVEDSGYASELALQIGPIVVEEG